MTFVLSLAVLAFVYGAHVSALVQLTPTLTARTVKGPGNANIDLQTDCALRAFTVAYTAALQPSDWSFASNWSQLASSAFQMHQCTPTRTPPFTVDPPPLRVRQYDGDIDERPAECMWQAYVDGASGSDQNPGTIDRPYQTVDYAIRQSRGGRTTAQTTACISVRAGIYYLGNSPPKHDPPNAKISQIGAIALTSIDSGLTISAYADESITFSAGRLLQPQWSVYKSVNNKTIYKTSLPPDMDMSWTRFNELYVDDWHAVRAKHPNGDPYTHGAYSVPTGYNGGARGWGAPKVYDPSTEIHVSSPERNGTHFPFFQLGVGGRASVFDPPHNFWSTVNPPAGHNYVAPSSITYDSNELPNVKDWTNPTDGYIVAFQGRGWGSWAFDIGALDLQSSTIHFNNGGFQEARGFTAGGDWYVTNILEILDDDNEWYADPRSRTLYYMPNQTLGIPKTIVASQMPCIISMHGDSVTPVEHVTISGITFTHSANTFMSKYEAPSGGDWSFHRGAAVFLEGTAYVSLYHNRFTQNAGNSVLVSNWNINATISTNEFSWLGDHAIIVAGSADGIDGVSNTNQPTNTLITRNLFTELGAYIKQCGATYQALSRATEFSYNALFNMPRAGININDGFAGGTLIHHNVMFNANRESHDHGPINTWDRQPYLTTQATSTVPSLTPAWNRIYRNLLFVNYGSYFPIDHDDGSAYYQDHHNVGIYGGKKNYLGHSKEDHFELWIYPDGRTAQGAGQCIEDQGVERGLSGWGEVWSNCTCAMYSSSQIYAFTGCDVKNLYVPYLAGNTFLMPKGTEPVINCGIDNLSLEQWQQYGQDIGSTIQQSVSISNILMIASEMLSQ